MLEMAITEVGDISTYCWLLCQNILQSQCITLYLKM